MSDPLDSLSFPGDSILLLNVLLMLIPNSYKLGGLIFAVGDGALRSRVILHRREHLDEQTRGVPTVIDCMLVPADRQPYIVQGNEFKLVFRWDEKTTENGKLDTVHFLQLCMMQ
ncbi:hypothetical protein Clacol_005137 [Clathrus columnatus]|uniref:Uncharacterized protein n=1 Tax=Clathrus columnatus TaxID=1419009 RepID=A0AAV5ACI9_9AGAM|nr:hypothetical protein Clacol_005137 [Clathrus columnatus]